MKPGGLIDQLVTATIIVAICLGMALVMTVVRIIGAVVEIFTGLCHDLFVVPENSWNNAREVWEKMNKDKA